MLPQRGAMLLSPPFPRTEAPPPFRAPSPGVPPYVPPFLRGGRHRPTPPAARRGRSPHLIVHGWAQQRRGPRSFAPAAAAVSLPGRRGGGERISSPALSTSEAALSVPPTPLPSASAAACSVAAPHGPAARLIVCHSQAAPAPRPPRGTGNRLSATAAPARRQCPRAARRGARPRPSP